MRIHNEVMLVWGSFRLAPTSITYAPTSSFLSLSGWLGCQIPGPSIQTRYYTYIYGQLVTVVCILVVETKCNNYGQKGGGVLGMGIFWMH